MPGLKSGTRVGDYEVLRLIARGGMGEVYEAHDLILDRRIALKVMTVESDLDDYNARFMREARTLAKISHPNIVTVYSINTHLDSPYIAMEYVHGISLKEVLRHYRIEPDVVVNLFDQILRGVTTLHNYGIIHRDLKPENILIRDNGQVKLLDLGISKTFGVPSNSDPNIKIGTPRYMAPEVRAGADASIASDIWSLGAVMFECLTGKQIDTSLMNDQLQISEDDFELIPQNFRLILASMVAAEPENRYKDTGHIIDEFRRLGETRATPKRFAEFRQELRILIEHVRPETSSPSYASEHPTVKVTPIPTARAQTPAAHQPRPPAGKNSNQPPRQISIFFAVAAVILILMTVGYLLSRSNVDFRPIFRFLRE